MPNQAAARIIGQDLGKLTYPGDITTKPFVVPLLQFRNTPGTMPQEMSDEVETVKMLAGAAIVHSLESAGMDIVSSAELKALRVAAAVNEPQRHRQPRIKCRCGQFLFSLDITDFDTDNPTVYGPELIRSLSTLSPECALNHRPIGA